MIHVLFLSAFGDSDSEDEPLLLDHAVDFELPGSISDHNVTSVVPIPSTASDFARFISKIAGSDIYAFIKTYDSMI